MQIVQGLATAMTQLPEYVDPFSLPSLPYVGEVPHSVSFSTLLSLSRVVYDGQQTALQAQGVQATQTVHVCLGPGAT